MERIGSYAVLRELGAGGMGTVYLARSRGGRLVAVKVARPELAADASFRARFRAEVEAARRVGGFHTAQVVDADPDGEPPWLATAYVPGPTLAQLIADQGPLRERELRDLGAALAEALQAVHGCGLVHRDLKPANIVMAPDGPRVLDFGIARAVESTRLTATGHAFGTPGYLAPEQAAGGEVTGAADVFALGAVLVTAAGGRAFGDGNPMALMYRSVHTPADLSAVPPGLRTILGACLAKDPALRPGPDHLLDAFSGGPDSVHPPTLVTSVPPPPAPGTAHGAGAAGPDALASASEAAFEAAFEAQDTERILVINARGITIGLVGLPDAGFEFRWHGIRSIGHVLDRRRLQFTLFVECVKDTPYDCTLTAPDEQTYQQWAQHLPAVLDHYCE